MTALRNPTIKDVAALSGVSHKTVSRVVNGESGVHEKTKLKVQKAIAELGYRPDLSARSLRGAAHSYALGLVYDNPNAHYVISMQAGVLSACEDRGYSLQILPLDASSPHLAAKLLVASQRSRLAGLILTPPMSEQPSLIASLTEHGVRCVRVVSASHDPENGPCIYVDDRSAAYAITAHLIQLGHARIGFLGGDREHASNMERYAGYMSALAHYGIALDEQLVISSHFTFDDGFRGARKLLASEQRPTAIFGSNDEIAAGVLAAARSIGLSVPGDLSIAGFEDSPFSRQAWPPLTTAKQSPTDIARNAALLLIQIIEGAQPDEGKGTNLGFVPQLVIRGSTAPPRALL